MLYIVEHASRIFGLGGLVVSACLGMAVFSGSVAEAQNSIIGATVCQATSTISLSQPASDSTVTQPTVPIAGTVDQANQIEVYVDEMLDGIIPLTIGQTDFTGSVQMTTGTHTIKVVAISVCPGGNGTASSVVTYEQPPNTTPSEGEKTPTRVEEPGGVQTVNTAGGEISESGTGGTLFPEQLSLPFQRFLGWLNISTADTSEPQALSPWRAIVVGSGLYLLVVGVATTALQFIANVPTVAALLPQPTAAGRVKWLSWGFRGLGVLLLLGGLFL